MKKLVLLLAILVAMSLTIPAAAQDSGQPPNEVCESTESPNFPGLPQFPDLAEGYLCLGDFALSCPTGELAEVGETLSPCFDLFKGERFECLVTRIVDLNQEGFFIEAFCTPTEELPEPQPGQQQRLDQQQPSQQPAGGAAPITQEGEQESVAGEIDQSFDVS